MKRRITFLMALLSLSSVLLGSVSATRAQGGRPWGDKSSPFGAIVSLGNRVRDDEMPTMIKLMSDAGVQWNREEISWDQVQLAPDGPFRWDGDAAGFHDYDRAIQLQRDAGFEILGLLDYNPAWFKSKNPHPDEWLSRVQDFLSRHSDSSSKAATPS